MGEGEHLQVRPLSGLDDFLDEGSGFRFGSSPPIRFAWFAEIRKSGRDNSFALPREPPHPAPICYVGPANSCVLSIRCSSACKKIQL